MKSPTQLKRGFVEYTLLTVINSEYMFFNAEGIRTYLENTELAIPKGTLYSALFKLRKEKIVGYFSTESDIGQPRKYYFATEKGKNILSELDRYWETINNTIKSLRISPRL